MIARLPALVILPILLVAFLSIIPECSYSTPQEMPNIQKRAQDFLQPELSLSVANNPIDRGNRQTVTAEVFDLQSKQVSQEST